VVGTLNGIVQFLAAMLGGVFGGAGHFVGTAVHAVLDAIGGLVRAFGSAGCGALDAFGAFLDALGCAARVVGSLIRILVAHGNAPEVEKPFMHGMVSTRNAACAEFGGHVRPPPSGGSRSSRTRQ